jgi:beta-phosphoglucomutase
MIKAAIFDLDGVIIDTAHYHYIAWKRLASEFGITLTPAHNELLKGVSRMRSLDIILSLGNIELPADQREQLAEKKNKWFVEYIESIRPEEIFPGVVDLIKNLRAKHIKVGLASSSKNAPRVIELLEIANQFDTLIDYSYKTRS